VATDTAVWITTEPLVNRNAVSLVRIDPATNTVAAEFAEGVDAIGVDLAGRYLWVVSYGGSLFVVDTATNAVVYRDRSLPVGVTLGGDRLTFADDSIWITAQQPGTVIRMNPRPYTR